MRNHYLVVFNNNERVGNVVVHVDGPLTGKSISEIEDGIAERVGARQVFRGPAGSLRTAPIVITNIIPLEGP